MRRPHVYERPAPRSRSEFDAPVARSTEVATFISRAIPALIDAVRSDGLDSVADALEIARKQAEIATGRGKAMVVE